VLTLTLVFDEAAITIPDSCREAIDQYQSAKSDVSDALRAYATCVSDSKGRDDCSSEFSTLRMLTASACVQFNLLLIATLVGVAW
jgi:hypothetical protein